LDDVEFITTPYLVTACDGLWSRVKRLDV
jgi:hypothetical protein